ncbi:phosphoglycerate dehydrogenase [Microbacterium sp. YY-01]|uniref:phosphoglycerate dehydrogenase n=1 Tax=Microbacterium sp. YY-01 TaxID=3421634 RepID=UPI003D1660AB
MTILVTATSLCRHQQHPQLQRLRELGDVVFNDQGRPLTGPELQQWLPGVDAVLAGVDDYTAEALAAADRLRVISRYGVGTDRIDLDAAQRHGIAVTRTPGANAEGVAELALGLMFSVARRIPTLHEQVREGGWPRITGIELSGRRLGVVGAGAIGQRVARAASGMGMTVYGYDPFVDAETMREAGMEPRALDDIFAVSDVLTLHVPLTEDTRHLVDARRIAAMPRDAIIINTARGGLLDEGAALAALETGHLWGVGLDAYEIEPPVDSPLVAHPHAVSTPHAGSHTAEAVDRTARAAVDNLIAAVS